LNDLALAAARRFARLTTRVVVSHPALWRLFRRPLRANFDALAPAWEEMVGDDALAPLTEALGRLEAPPARALDLGTGTGKGAQLVAERFPEAEVLGVDLSPGMIEEAGRLLPRELSGRVRFQVADASALPLDDGAFDLVVLLNMIPFFSELARVSAPGATVVVSHTSGAETPIYTPPETLRGKLERLGFDRFEELAAGNGTAFLARKWKPE
jgi:ubiquinone/menaquinone biosynthesis C-methylase UbiE